MKRFDNFCSNLDVLLRADKEDLDNEFIVSGIIDKFFVQFELSWKVLKELLRYEGKAVAATGSPRAIIKAAFSVYNFLDETVWLSMLKDRNDMTHIYSEQAAKRLVQTILTEYIPVFQRMREELLRYYGGNLEDI